MNFCTLFDSNFLIYGLALHQSLLKQCNNFKLYVAAFDNNCYQLLKDLNLENLVVISLSDFEDERLLEIKEGRSKGEYCWTCTSSIIKYCFTAFNLDHITYLDADLFFYADPSTLLQEMKGHSVLITPHWYYPSVDSSKRTGAYCVQFLYFKNDFNGNKVLDWWRDRCIEWCYNRIEDGKFGDQKYLDCWPAEFQGVKILENRGGGLAPWNLLNYQISFNDGEIKIKYGNHLFSTVFFHFHGLRIYTNDKGKRMVNFGNYKIDVQIKNMIYKPYIAQLEANQAWLDSLNYQNNIRNSFVFKKKFSLKEKIYNLLKGINNIYDINKLLDNG